VLDVYRHLGSATLKTGEQLEVGVVHCPDPSWGAQVQPLLGHKDSHVRFTLDAAFAHPLDDLDMRFYVGTIGGQAITNIMIAGAAGSGGKAGILGHVYTRPEHRQKGAFRHLMAAQMDDCRRSGYVALTLGTAFESHPYWIYHSFGFRSIDGVSGKMKWLARPGADAEWFLTGPTSVRPMRWGDWPRMDLLAFQPPAVHEPLPRSWTFRVKDQGGGVEGLFQLRQRTVSRSAPITPVALVTDAGAVAGWAVLQPDDLAFGDGYLLDLYVHAAFEADAPKLLDAMPWPRHARVSVYTSGDDTYRTRTLNRAGFRPVATLPGWLKHQAESADLHVLARTPEPS
jgi:GNAT superfamily N-acetyltransferase